VPALALGGGLTVEGRLIDRLVAVDQGIPERSEILALREHTIDDVERRLRHLLAIVGESTGAGTGRADWRRERGRTVAWLPFGARGAVYHASGAMRISMGLAPLEHLYEDIPGADVLTKDVEALADRLRLAEWVRPGEQLAFERLWQIKAQAASREGTPTDPVLCRAVGAFRHVVRGIPVWGPASAAVTVAGGSALDRVDIQIRETTGEVVTDAAILPLDRVAASVVTRLRALLGGSKIDLAEIAQPAPLRFGYISLARRKPQRMLAPAFVTSVDIKGDYPHSLVFVIAATEEPFVSFEPTALEGPPMLVRRTP
jgi:hypothetical protein